MSFSLQRKASIGIIWAGIGQIGSQAIHYFMLLILAWLLSPSDFGLSGLAMIFVLFTQSIELGQYAALIQQKEFAEADLSTAFWTNLVISFLIAIITYISADGISLFMGDARVSSLLGVLSIVFPITGLGMVHKALLEKELCFRQLALLDFASEVGFGSTGLAMAIMNGGVWSLVGATVAQRLIRTVMLWIVVPWRPKLEFDFTYLGRVLGFSLYTMVGILFARSIAQMDYFVVGRWLGSEALGYYTLAFQIAIVPQQRLMDVLRKVAFPAFSLVQTDLDRLRSGFMEGIRYLFILLAPISLFLAVLAPWFVRTVYNEKWLPAIQPMRILAIAGLFYGFDVAESLYYAVGKPKFRIWIIGLRLVLFLVFVMAFGISRGVAGVAFSLLLSVFMTSFLGFIAVAKIIQSPTKEILRPFWLAVRMSVCASVPAVLLSFFLRQVAASWLVLVTLGIVMGTIYLLILVLSCPHVLRKMYTSIQWYLHDL
jgi:O-antigen/teichoic acid export membrane protein